MQASRDHRALGCQFVTQICQVQCPGRFNHALHFDKRGLRGQIELIGAQAKIDSVPGDARCRANAHRISGAARIAQPESCARDFCARIAVDGILRNRDPN